MGPKAELLNKLGGHVKKASVSEAAFSIRTEDGIMPVISNHASERAEQRCVSMKTVCRTLLRGVVEETTDKDGKSSVKYIHDKHKVWTNLGGTIVKSVT